MRKLNRMLFREVRKSAGQLIAIIIVAAIGVMMYTGINSTFMNLEKTRDEYYTDCNFEHMEAMGYGIPASMEEEIQSIPGVKAAAGRIILSARLQMGGSYPELRVLPLADGGGDGVNNIYITGGKPLGDGSMDECIVEQAFADGNGLKVGDMLAPDIDGKKMELKITGICKSPEYVYVLEEPQDLMPDPEKFGVIYISRTLSQTLTGAPGYINNIAILLEPGTSITDVKPEVEELLNHYDGFKLIEREDQLSNFMLNEEIEGLKSMGIEVPLLFFAVASVIIYIMMGRVIENKRAFIGILKSLGYKNRQILIHYMTYPVIIASFGSMLGVILGYFLGMMFTYFENTYFGFPVLHYSFYMDFIVPSIMLTFFFCMLSAYIACKTVFRISPSESIKPPAPKRGKKVIVENIPFIWRKLKFSRKMKLRSLSRNWKRNALAAVGVVLSTVLLVIGFSCNDSLDYMVKQIYDVKQNYDIKVSFKSPLGIDEIERIRKIDNISLAEPVFEGFAEVKKGEYKKDVSITASKDMSSLYKVVDEEGLAIRLPEDGVLVPERLLESLDVKIDGYIDIKPYFPGTGTSRIKISGTSPQYLGLGVDMNIDSLSSILGRNEVYTGAFIRLASSSAGDIRNVKDELYGLPTVDLVEYREESKENMKKNLEPFSLFSAAAILLAAVMSIAVIYNITAINIYEKKRELCSLKVMGFTRKEVRSSVYSENIIVGVVSLILGLPLGRFFSTYILGYFYTTDAYAFPVTTYIPSYVYAAASILIFVLFAQMLLKRKIDKIDMVDVLKVRE